MKVVIVTVALQTINPVPYKVLEGNKAVEYEEPVICSIYGVLAKTLKKDEKVKVIYITYRDDEHWEKNRAEFECKLDEINKKIEADINYETVFIEFKNTKKSYYKLITELADRIPKNAEIFADISYGFKILTPALFCALRFAEEFNDAIVKYICYGQTTKWENNKAKEGILVDTTSLYYLFKLMNSMVAADAETASRILKDFLEI